MRAEQYRRRPDDDSSSSSGAIRVGAAPKAPRESLGKEEEEEEGGSCCCGKTAATVQAEVPLLAGERKEKPEPNLRKEICSLCPLLILIFVEVGALGLPAGLAVCGSVTSFARSHAALLPKWKRVAKWNDSTARG